MQDRFRRDDMKKQSKFDGLSAGTQRALKRAAKGAPGVGVRLTPAQAAEIDIDDGWMMVGPTQVAISGMRAYRL